MTVTVAIASLISGLVFGIGLIMSGMGNPAKVQNFLDFLNWDPSLAFVMGGAIGIGFPAFAWAKMRQKRQQSSLLGQTIELPVTTAIDARLLAGAALFGVGWGLAGFCPAPAIMSLTTLQAPVWLFVAAMLLGMALHALWSKHSH